MKANLFKDTATGNWVIQLEPIRRGGKSKPVELCNDCLVEILESVIAMKGKDENDTESNKRSANSG